MTSLSARIYDVLVDSDEDHGCGELPEDSCREVPENAGRIVGALTLTKAGDLVVDPKTVLTWLLAAGGAPAFMTGMLVPVREAGSLLPQAALVPVIRGFGVRKWVWVAGASGQAAAVVAMAVLAATANGAVLGGGVLAALAVFALSRALASISSKDVLGKTIRRGERGQVIGYAGSASGAVAIAVGLGIGLLGGSSDGTGVIVGLLMGAAAAWVLALAVFATIHEHRDAGGRDAAAALGGLGLLRSDASFRRFVAARALLFVTALSPPFVVVLAQERVEASLTSLGGFVVASGLASLVGSPVWGRFADRSSRWTMTAAAIAGASLVIGFLALAQIDAVAGFAPLYPAAYFAVALVNSGARVGRKTYVVDLGRGNKRTEYVAASNTVIGVALLAVGGVTSALSAIGPEAALLLLSGMGVAAAVMSLRLAEV